MKCSNLKSNNNHSKIAVSFLILIQITSIVCSVSTNVRTMSESSINYLPENYFQNEIGELTEIKIVWNDLKTIPENLFKNLTNLKRLYLHGNSLTSLPANLFKDLINLRYLELDFNNLITLPENIFQNQHKLEHLELDNNDLKTLTKSQFGHVIKQLTELQLYTNPWQCDCDFIEMIRSRLNVLQYASDTRCVDGKQVADKIKHPLITMITKGSSASAWFSSKYVRRICGSLSSNETIGICPSECSCLIPMNNLSVLIDCSNSELTSVPIELTNIIQQIPTIKEIELNFDNNNITNLPNTTINGFELITKISAKNNLIETISRENLPENLMDIDLSGNKLESLTPEVKKAIGDRKNLRTVRFACNPWSCDDQSLEPIQLNNKVDHENLVCIGSASSSSSSSSFKYFWIFLMTISIVVVILFSLYIIRKRSEKTYKSQTDECLIPSEQSVEFESR